MGPVYANKHLLFICISNVTGHPSFLLPTSDNLLREGQDVEIILSDPLLLSRNGYQRERKEADGWIIQCLKSLEWQHRAVVKRKASRSSSAGSNPGSPAS